MMMFRLIFLLSIGSIGLANCQKETNPPDMEEVMVGNDRDAHGCIASAGYQWSSTKSACVRPWEEGQIDVEAEPLDDQIQEFGKITNIEDGAYPMFNLAIAFPERNMSANFELNVEAVPLDPASLLALQDQYISFSYTSDLDMDLMEMRLNDQYLMGGNATDIQEHWTQVIGQFHGADRATMSDLPKPFSLEQADGTIIDFETWITDEMVAANGTEVTAWFSTISRNKITNIAVSEE